MTRFHIQSLFARFPICHTLRRHRSAECHESFAETVWAQHDLSPNESRTPSLLPVVRIATDTLDDFYRDHRASALPPASRRPAGSCPVLTLDSSPPPRA